MQEIFTFNNLIYDISGLNNLISRDPYRYGPFRCRIDDAFLHHISGYMDIDEARMAEITPERLQVPPISVRLENGETRVVDGHHRIHHMVRSGKKEFLMFIVEYQDSLPFISKKKKFTPSKKVRLR